MIHLARTVPVSSFDAEGTVAVGRDRPEFLAVARLAADLDRPIGARDVLRELLGPRPDVLGWRVIERCVDLGLLERSREDGTAALSEAGRVALGRGEVLVPEEGAWRFYFVDDPLVPAVVVHAQRLEVESVRKEREAMKAARNRGEALPRSERMPDLLHGCRGEPPRVSVQTNHLFQLLELGERGAQGPSGELRLVLTWDDKPALRLTGRLPSFEPDVKPAPIDTVLVVPDLLSALRYETLWKALIGHATGVQGADLDRWRAAAGKPVVPVSFRALPAAARHAFRRDIEVPESSWRELGRFEATVLKGVDLVPASESDAQAWLSWLQWESVNDYITPRGLDKKSGDLLALFPHHRPRALSAAELLAVARDERTERSWFLLAPSDLGLWS